VGRIPPPQGRLPTPCGQGVLIGGYCHKAFLGGGEKGKVAVFGEEEREKGEFWSSWTSSYVALYRWLLEGLSKRCVLG